MKTLRIAAAALLVVATGAVSAAADLKQAMVAFDRAYIPALAFTTQGKLEESRRAMDLLNRQWVAFKSAQGPDKPDARWKDDVAGIDGLIAAATGTVSAGQDLGKAREALDAVRGRFMEMRERNGIDYYLDRLRRFHDPMEAIVRTAKDQKPDTLTDADLSRLRAALPEAEAAWRGIESARVDPEFALTGEQEQALKEMLSSQAKALAALRTALDNEDRPAVIRTAAAVKPAFSRIYMSFGDFKAVTQ